jgi:hypothetical protein
MTRFVILAAPRTGSNLLCTLLNSHPEILCHHEIFNPQGIFTALGFHDDSIDRVSLRQRDRDPILFLDRIWQTRQGHGCIGFKSTRGQNEVVLKEMLEDPNVKKIVLRRLNRIKTYVSEKIAQATQQWEVYQEQELILPRPCITVDRADLVNHINENNQFYSSLQPPKDQSNQRFLDVQYEKLFTNSEHRRLLRFLEVRDCEHDLTPASVKQNPMDLRQSVSNFEELAVALDDSELEAELRDGGI